MPMTGRRSSGEPMSEPTPDPHLVFVLGDQLSDTLASLQVADKRSAVILMCEVADETTYVPHHPKKIALILSAMRHHTQALRADGWTVDYVKLDDPDNTGSFTGELTRALTRHEVSRIFLTEPGEWRVLDAFNAWGEDNSTPLHILPDDRFLCSRAEFADWADGKKTLRMEFFYREMRRKTGLLMDGDQPEGGKWNYDKENRKPADDDLFMPERQTFAPDDITNDVLDLVGSRFDNNFGDLKPFGFAVTKAQAEEARDHFLSECLEKFGTYQDAMLERQPFLYHSLISFYINLGLLDAVETCELVQRAYIDGRRNIPLNAAEGFIRQIIGWREYMRGIYWLSGRDYTSENYFGAKRDLPGYYWSGETDMNCMRSAITQTKEEAYAHHIQRLMVTGNLAMIAGIDPHQVHEWYLAVYADAYEWVEAPNVIGMSQFADGGQLGSKPYAASGAYINRMSDYCGGCTYSVSKKTGEGACPFNALYWDFLVRNRSKLEKNTRIQRIYSNWDRMDEDKRDAYLAHASDVLEGIEDL